MDESAAIAFLREKFGPAAQIREMRLGEWSAVYSVKTADADLVARFSAYDEDFEKDAYAERYSTARLPIPPIIEWGPAPGGFYAVARRASGEHIDGLDETRMRRVLPSLFAALDAMRAVDLSGASGSTAWLTASSGSAGSNESWEQVALKAQRILELARG